MLQSINHGKNFCDFVSVLSKHPVESFHRNKQESQSAQQGRRGAEEEKNASQVNISLFANKTRKRGADEEKLKTLVPSRFVQLIYQISGVFPSRFQLRTGLKFCNFLHRATFSVSDVNESSMKLVAGVALDGTELCQVDDQISLSGNFFIEFDWPIP